MKLTRRVLSALVLLTFSTHAQQEASKSSRAKDAPPAASAVSPQARKLHFSSIVLDTHDDTPQRMLFEKGFDLGERHADGHVDIPRMREGGMNAIFFSIWVPSEVTGPEAVKRAVRLIDTVHAATRTYPRDLMLATTAADVRRAHKEGKIAALMGMEGGHMIDDDLRILRMVAALGVRYMTLAHFKNNNWADSSTDTPKHNGLTAFGKDVVREMNRLGMMVDISHVSDKTFFDALEVTRAPVIASHSSCRSISGHPRNMTDEMIRALARNGGVVHINYHVSYLDQDYLDASRKAGIEVTTYRKLVEGKCGGNPACETIESGRLERDLMASGRLPKVGWEKIVEHIDHVVKLVGPDHAGLGSDFDGATMPFGMEDATLLPRITDALLKKGYVQRDIAKILGGNTLRVMEQVERISREMRAAGK